MSHSRKTTKRQQAKSKRKKQKHFERERKNVKAKRSKRCQDFGIKNLNPLLRQLPEGVSVESTPTGQLKISQAVPRAEADETAQHLLDVAKANGLEPVEGNEDATVQHTRMQVERTIDPTTDGAGPNKPTGLRTVPEARNNCAG